MQVEPVQETLNIVPKSDLNPNRNDDLCQGAPVAEVTALERQRLLHLAYRVLWNRTEAEDAVQEALLTAHEKAGQLRDHGKRWSWLCRIVIQKCYTHGQQQQRQAKHYESYANRSGAVYEKPATESGSGSQRLELKELVRHAIAKLSTRQQQVFILKDIEGMEYAAVAEILEISQSTARVHAKDARETLREIIRRNNPEIFG